MFFKLKSRKMQSYFSFHNRKGRKQGENNEKNGMGTLEVRFPFKKYRVYIEVCIINSFFIVEMSFSVT